MEMALIYRTATTPAKGRTKIVFWIEDAYSSTAEDF